MADRITGFVTPTFEESFARAKADYASRLGSNPQLRNGVVPVLAHVDAMLATGEYTYLDWLAAQTLPLYADGENLDAWGRMFGVLRKPAERATGTATMTGNDGAVIPVGAALTATDGTAYSVTVSATIAGGSAAVAVQADEGGAVGNRVGGETLSLVEAVEGVDPEATVVSLAGGVDVEDDGAPGVAEDYRGRVLERIRTPPHGGSAADYVLWAKATPAVAVTRAWVDPGAMGEGTVVVRFMVDGSTETGIPTAEMVALVQAYIDGQRPVTAQAFALAPVGVPLDLTITGLDPDTADVRAAIADELADLVYRKGFPACTVYHSWIVSAISTAAGEDHHATVAPAGDIAHAAGEIPIKGVVTYA